MAATGGGATRRAAAAAAADGAGSGRWLDVCASEALDEGGDGVRFEWPDPHDAGRPAPAFVVRFDGRARAYLNRCRHLEVELDWLPGRFFDDSGLYLICSTHGALYEADSGDCVAGPCRGARLAPLRCEERDGRVRVALSVGSTSTGAS